MKYLILTEPDDSHAATVKLALESEGQATRCLFTADLPTMQTNTVYVNSKNYRWKSADNEESISEQAYDVVWWRRARKPYLPKGMTHPDDYKFVLRENTLFYESLTDTLAPQAWWVNPKGSAIRANSKLLQLKVASDCGLTIPSTLCSNDPQDIRYFLLKNNQEGVVYKPLCSNYWFEDETVKIAYTTRINASNLPDNNLLQLSPGIFQKEIKKKYELRVTCFGSYLVAAKIDSQVHAEGLVDWRAIPQAKIGIEPYMLPPKLMGQIRMFMRRMGLVFGSLDFIVTPEGDYVFLEVNEQGQFLWVEECNPEIKMLDIFIQFLLNKSVKFAWKRQFAMHTIEMYRQSMDEIVKCNLQNHVNVNTAAVYSQRL